MGSKPREPNAYDNRIETQMSVPPGPGRSQIASPESLPPSPGHEPIRLLLRDLGTTPRGLTGREATRRLVAYGPNELRRQGGRTWPKELAKQFTHPLALLLWAAAALTLVDNTVVLAAAVVGVIVLNLSPSWLYGVT